MRLTRRRVAAALAVAAAAFPATAVAAPAPPNATARGAGDARTLERGSYCWHEDGRSACKRSSARTGPLIRARDGRVTFDLRFTPTKLVVRVGSRKYRLAARRTVTWRVPAGLDGRRFFVLEARTRFNDAEYLGFVRAH